MGKLKALQSIAEATSEVSKGNRLLGDLDGAGKPIKALGGPSSLATEIKPLPGLDNIAEYSKVQGELDKAASVPAKPADVRAEIARRELEADEIQRIHRISPDYTDVSFSAQARTPEEFSSRMEQFRDAEFSENATLHGVGNNVGDTSSNLKDRVAGKQQDWLAGSEQLNTSIRRTRTGPALKIWADDSPYKRSALGDTGPLADEPLIFYHVDSRTDPTGNPTPIQFEANANEFGLHVGSQRAASDIGGGALPIARQTQADLKQFFVDFENDLKLEFEDVEDFDLAGAFQRAVDEKSRNMFIRPGDISRPGLAKREEFNELVDELFEDMVGFSSFSDVPPRVRRALDIPQVAAFKTRVSSIMHSNYNSSGFPMVTNVKKGLHIPDIGNFEARNIADQLFGRGIIADDTLEAIKQMPSTERNIALRSALEEQGYDHIIYHNAAEDAGNYSLILFDEANMQNLYSPNLPRSGTAGVQAQQAAMLAPFLGALGASVRDDK